MSMSNRAKFEDMYQTNPIVLTGGIADSQPGGAISVLDLMIDNFASFKPVPGSSLLKNQAAQYPFANQTVAANAVIADGLTLSMHMICPASTLDSGVSYLTKQSIITALVQSLTDHVSQGGLFSVFTPAYVYNDGLLLDLRDVTSEDLQQKQVIYQWDFYFPLTTMAAVDGVQSTLMQKLTSGATIVGEPSWSSRVAQPSDLRNGGGVFPDSSQ